MVDNYRMKIIDPEKNFVCFTIANEIEKIGKNNIIYKNDVINE